VAVKVVSAASEFVGVNVATVPALLKLTEPETVFPFGSVSVNDAVLGTTASENVAAGATVTGLPEEPELGVTLDTLGGKVPDGVVYATSTQ
jgi:hypothetical protein